ncbi:MAG: hypothetical protein QXF56_02230 [Candidatus Micrarchaeia archaeon]
MTEYTSGFNILIGASTILLSVGLALISLLAYRKNRKRIILFVSLAFLAYFARIFIKFTIAEQSPLTVSLSNILDFLTLALIFFAVVRE